LPVLLLVEIAVGVAEATLEIPVVVVVAAGVVLDTVTGILLPLTAGKVVNVTHDFVDTSGHTSLLTKPLSAGPVGPLSHFHVAFRP